MKTFRRRIFTTHDGFECGSAEEATKHAEERYGSKVLLLAKRITACDGKYTSVVAMVEANMSLLREIVAWNDDKNSLEQAEDE